MGGEIEPTSGEIYTSHLSDSSFLHIYILALSKCGEL